MNYSKLNSEQFDAVFSNDQKILCLAGAGTGKSFTLLARIEHQIELGADPQSILALTFTNAAAFEMKSRWQSSHPEGATPEFRTFHGLCYSLIVQDKHVRNALGYAEVPSVASESDERWVRATAEFQTGIKLSDKKRSGAQVLTPKEQAQLKILQQAEVRLMQKNRLITFDRLCYGVCKLFEDDDPVIQQYKAKYKYIFVDEFQDTDPRQWRFVRSFKDAKLYVVGDALQSLYAFRGADSSIIKALAVDPEWTTYRLSHNYRSTRQICEFANEQSKYANDEYRIEISSDVDGPSVQRIRIDRSFKPNMLPNVTAYRDESVAILARTNKEVDAICEYLYDCAIPYASTRTDLFPMKLLRSLLDPQYFIDWMLSSLPYKIYRHYILSNLTPEEFLNLYYNSEDFEVVSEAVLKYEELKGLYDTITSNSEFLDELEAQLGIHATIDAELLTKDRSELIKYLLEASTSDSTIYVGTIHSVKGLEYDNVILTGVGGSTFRLTNEENNNLYYVGITRAKKRLIIYEEDKL